ncbi:RHS repeat protein [Pseudomonas sp. P115]|uniref:RHS repeat-associated core domain-containing protein n=1 Tax=Pseudomonas pisciculturae TaxID=2730413 RepID=UPI001357821F|nr:RHS repeat-associated core domain-containing protein [Pseudomonas pisciculturae]MBF6027339.1 RHS repeat protein [Pseudomonas pisciculturae]
MAYHRTNTAQQAETRVTRQTFDHSARAASHWDPRLWANGQGPNLSTVYSLSGNALRSENVDSGWRVRLMGVAGELLSEWDGRHSHLHIEYDNLLRPIFITEKADGEPPNVTERLTYGDSTNESSAHNQCGALKRHDDTAGCRHIADYGLSGNVLSESRQFLIALSTPNWPQALNDRDALLETEVATTRWQFDATGAVVSQLDARRNETLTSYNVCGQLEQIELKREGLPDKVLLNQRIYNATGQLEQETAGNGVRTLRRYDTQNGRLLQLTSRLGLRYYQDFHYDYDPVGNVVRISDSAQPARHFRNRHTTPTDSYRYNTLYHLIEATGRESIPTNQGPGLPELHSPQLDPTRMWPYKQTFSYDEAGNLNTLVHEGHNSYTREMITPLNNNRSVLKTKTGTPDVDSSFDDNGNLQLLNPGASSLSWNTRNQLIKTILLLRPTNDSDSEHYQYSAQGLRARKISTRTTNATVNRRETRYLPNLEIHRDSLGHEHHVINIEIGDNATRTLHWVSPPPRGVNNNQIRYNFGNHLGSCMLELNEYAGLLTQESYYAFGGTASWSATNESDAKFKTIRYAMKERDITGLYYYGFRYYAPWLHRWLNPDPLGSHDGLNTYPMTHNNPVRFTDSYGLAAFDVLNEHETKLSNNKQHITHRNPDELSEPDKSDFIGAANTAIEIGERALVALNEEVLSADTTDKLKHLFGSDIINNEATKKSAAAALSGVLEKTLFGLKKDRTENYSRFVFTTADPKNPSVSAHVPGNIPQEQKMIYMHQNVKNTNRVFKSRLILHEATHLYSGTKDFWYLNANSSKVETHEEIKQHDTLVLTSSSAIANSSPNEENMNNYQKTSYTTLVDSIHGSEQLAPWPHIHRMAAFKKNSAVRIAVIANNAESVAAFSSLFYKHH